MRAGSLTKRVTLQRRSTEIDEYGGQSPEWADLATVWAGIVNVSGKEAPQSGMVRAVGMYTFTMRYFAGLTPADRIFYRGRAFEIVYINDVDERHLEFEITAREGESSV